MPIVDMPLKCITNYSYSDIKKSNLLFSFDSHVVYIRVIGITDMSLVV